MRLPIDTTAVKFAAAGPAEPVLDFETRQAKTDEHGVPLFSILVFAAGTGVQDSISTWLPVARRFSASSVGSRRQT
ncbi:hypothetical protein EBU60_05390 [bacterium]|nr:hypothetical protein [bacterium]